MSKCEFWLCKLIGHKIIQYTQRSSIMLESLVCSRTGKRVV